MSKASTVWRQGLSFRTALSPTASFDGILLTINYGYLEGYPKVALGALSTLETSFHRLWIRWALIHAF